jgi:hypothetical protein
MVAFEKQIHAVSMRVIDDLSERLEEADEFLGGKAAKLAKKWQKLDPDEKQHVIELLVGAATAGAAAISAIAKGRKAKKGKSMKKLGKKAVAGLATAAVGAAIDLKKEAKKKAKGK